jgi:hypothetical protein
MAIQKLNLTRDQFAAFLNDFEQIKQFEKLFKIVDEVAPSSDTTGISIQAGNADAAANDALAQIVSLAQSSLINSGAADQKATQALDTLGRIANLLEMSAAAPVIQNNNSIVTDYIDLNGNPPHFDKARRIVWNNVDQTADLGMDYGVIQQIGQEIYARVGNTTGVTIPNGTVVGFAGATSNALLVSPYLANGVSSSLFVLGIMTHDLPDSGQKGYCTTWGFVRGLNTSAFTSGDVLYASPSVAGSLTKVKPTAPSNVIPMAACIVSDATNGVIFVRPTITQMQYYGIFAVTIDYTPAAINTAYALAFDTTRISNGIVIGAPTSRIVVPQSGLYQFNATLQFISSSATNKNIWVWYRKNGVDVSNSARIVTVSVNNAYTPLSINEAISLAANEYVELMFASDNVNVTIDNIPATAFSPASPGVVIEVTQIQQ